MLYVCLGFASRFLDLRICFEGALFLFFFFLFDQEQNFVRTEDGSLNGSPSVALGAMIGL